MQENKNFILLVNAMPNAECMQLQTKHFKVYDSDERNNGLLFEIWNSKWKTLHFDTMNIKRKTI